MITIQFSGHTSHFSGTHEPCVVGGYRTGQHIGQWQLYWTEENIPPLQKVLLDSNALRGPGTCPE